MADTAPHRLSPERKLPGVLDALREEYGVPERPRREPLEVLIRGVLSQNTSDLNSGRAYRQLRGRFPSWPELAGANPEEIADAIRQGGLARQKAATIGSIMDWLGKRGEYSLDFLAQLDTPEAEKRLKEIKGVGVKTARLVLLFGLRRPTFVVDTHVLRVSRRLGLVPDNCGRVRAHRLLDELIPDRRKYPAHLNMIEHGRTLCRAQGPLCEGCPVRPWCLYLRKG